MTYAATMAEKVWVIKEASFDNAPVFTATDALDVMEVKITPAKEFEQVKNKVGSGSLQEEIPGYEGGTFSITLKMRPVGLGVAPGAGPLLEAGFGVETLTGSTSAVWTITDSQTIDTVAIGRQVGNTIWEFCSGAAVEQIEFNVGRENTITISGSYTSHGWVLGSPTTDAGSTTDTTLDLQADHASKVSVGAIVKFGTEDNSGAGYEITAVGTDGLDITFTPGLAGAVGAGDALLPIVPAHTTAGTPIGGLGNGLKIDTVALGVISGKVTFGTGIKLLDKESSSAKPIGVYRDDRTVEFDGLCYFEDANAEHLARTWDGDTHAIELRAGPDTANERFLFNLPKVRLDVAAPDSGDGDVATVVLKGLSRQSATSGDELTASLT